MAKKKTATKVDEKPNAATTVHPLPVGSNQTEEQRRLAEDSQRDKNWKRWGPYLSERQWGTVREDYSPDGNCWNYFPHDHARSRAYRWGEDGLLGITDRECRLCFGLALWNGRDPILKERLFGLTGPEGNHGEDVKELYYYLDSTPTHSYMKGLYKYPMAEYPYARLLDESRRRSRLDPEFEITDAGVFDRDRYFDVFVEYAKHEPEDILVRITVVNRSSEDAVIHVLPQLWYRNSWSWGCSHEGCEMKPQLRGMGEGQVRGTHPSLGVTNWSVAPGPDGKPPEILFTENESNLERLWDSPNPTPYVKDAFHRYVVNGEQAAVNHAGRGTKTAAHYVLAIPAGGQVVLKSRISAAVDTPEKPFDSGFDRVFKERIAEADEFYGVKIPKSLADEERRVARQSYAGLLWTKQFYHYIVKDWLDGDADQPKPPQSRQKGRNADWNHVYNRDVISMPDKWEYPWYAAWDLAFHMLPMARVDPQYAKEQLNLFLREWYMHPNGQIPAYEFALGDVNPPVHAWACWRVYKITGSRGQRDLNFLARTFKKLLINFTWWVNRKDVDGKHIFSGGFLGLDNIGVFDRSRPLPTGGHLEQADGTAWMAFYSATMLSMALELAEYDRSYEDVASKFFEHFVAIADAMNTLGGTGLWDEQDGFYYDQLHIDGVAMPLRIRSMVGLIPLFAVEILEEERLKKLRGFKKRMDWFLKYRRDLSRHISYFDEDNAGTHYLLAIPSKERLVRVLEYLLNENEFLSPFGIRSLSRRHANEPYTLVAGGETYTVEYTPGESTTALFGGNSNWRGPIWFPVNYLLIEALERYHHFYGDLLRVEFPTGSGRYLNLGEVAQELAARLVKIFLPDQDGHRPFNGGDHRADKDPYFRDLVLFHEYFHGDSGRGIGANHQTGWTSLVNRCFEAISQGTAHK